MKITTKNNVFIFFLAINMFLILISIHSSGAAAERNSAWSDPETVKDSSKVAKSEGKPISREISLVRPFDDPDQETDAGAGVVFSAEASSSSISVSLPNVALIPEIAIGYERFYRRFMAGDLVYDGPSGQYTFPISSILNSSCEGEFDLSGLTFKSSGTTYKVKNYIRIRVGYRKECESENKTTVWLVPEFMVNASDSLFESVSWTSDVGVFRTWGQFGLDNFAYSTGNTLTEISGTPLSSLIFENNECIKSPKSSAGAQMLFRFIFQSE